MCPMSAILYSTTVGVGVGVEGGGERQEARDTVSMLPHVPGTSGYIDNSFNLNFLVWKDNMSFKTRLLTKRLFSLEREGHSG